MTFYIALGAAILSAASIILHVVAPRTTWKGDARALQVVDKAKAYLEGK
jgi:hypothetical protein